MAEQSFIHRSLFLIGVILITVLIIIGRLYYLQIYEGQHFRSLAEGNRIALQPNLSLRGEVFDRNGVPLAQNKSTFRITLMKEKGTDINKALENLEPYIYVSPEEKENILKRSRKRQGLEPLTIKDHLTWEEVSLVEMNLEDLPGLSIEVGHIRTYPKDELVAHLLGYVSAPSEKEQDADPVLMIPGLAVGKVGIEKQLDKDLRGIPGHKQLEVNAGRRIVRELSDFPARSGKPLTLTIDLRLQEYAVERLSEHESGSAIVMDVNTGEVLAFVSHPSFDPNLFVDGISHHNWRELMDNQYVPLTNKAVSGTYPPASTLKVLSVVAALESGVVNENTTFFCPGYMYVGNHKFHCWRKHGHGAVNARKAIIESCDVYFYEVAKKMGFESLKQVYEEFGLASKQLWEYPHERSGLVPSDAVKRKKTGHKWTVTDTILSIIGQGYMLATPIQLSVVAARLASGKMVEPQLILTEDNPTFPSMHVDPHALQVVRDAMSAAVNSPQGTAFRFRLQEGAFAGKTGTSQVRRITMEERARNLARGTHLDWKYREHGLFIGYYPAESPKYAISVVLEHAGGGSKAAMAARDIIAKIQELEKEDAGKTETH